VPQGIPNNFYVPSFPYAPQPGWNNAAGFATYSNGNVWATQAAAALSLSALPSLFGGSNYAFGGAETFANGSGPGGFPPSLNTQVSQLLAARGGALPSAALYVVEGGGNNARHALEDLGANPSLGQIVSTISQASAQYAVDVGNIVDRLQAAGAQHIVVWNAPNVAAAPAISSLGPGATGLASLLVQNMNAALSYRLAGETGVSTFDVYGLVGQVIASPATYGLSNVTDACITGVCNPATNLFWDGIHPSAAGHQILADAFVAQVVPEPGAVWLMVAGLAGIGLARRRRA
jgi:outer membrane lipase/esterase